MNKWIFDHLIPILLIVGGTGIIAAQAPHPEPPGICFPTHKVEELRCDCLNQDKAEGCREGKREVETSVCKAYCHKAKCGCCMS